MVFYTREHGIIRGVAKGAKRLNSKFGSTLEPFSTVHITFFQKDDRELVSIQNAELLRSAFAVASDPAILGLFSYLSELLMAFLPPNDPNETVYRMIRACLDTDVSSAGRIEALTAYFEFWLLRLAGYMPDWSACYRCGKPFKDGSETILADGFHLFCPDCSPGAGSILGWKRRAIHGAASRMAPSEFLRFTEGRSEDVNEISGLLKRMITQSLGREILVGSIS